MAQNKFNFAYPTVSPNTTYAGELALPYITPAVSSNSIVNGYLTSLAGVRNKAVVSSLTSAAPVVGAACGTTDGDNLTLGESVLTTTDVMVNEAICRGTLYPTWAASQMNGSRNADPVDFIDFAVATVSGKAAEQVENMLYSGSTALGVGLVSNDGTIDNTGIQAGKMYLAANYIDLGAALSKANIEAKLEAVYNLAVTNCPAVLGKEDVQILLGSKAYGLYMQHLSGVLGVGGYDNKGTNQTYSQLSYLGVQVNMAYGMPVDAIILARKSNLFVGTNLGTDATEVNVIPRYLYDGSDYIQLVMRFGIGVQVGIKSDCILAVNQTIS